jgi:hypothetical protein
MPVALPETTIRESDGGLSELVTQLIKTHLPPEYEKKKNWGQTTEVFDGLHLKLDGVHLKTKRKKRTVNHGTWTMYRVRLSEPDQFTLRIHNLRALDDGRAGFDLEVYAPLELFGRLSEWQRGVQLFSLSADGNARVRLHATCALRMKIVSAKESVFPDVAIEPEVISAQILLESFRLERISQLDGPLVKQLGREAREVIEDELTDRNTEIVTKINQQIAKKQDKLRLPLSELANTKFGDLRIWVTKDRP